MAADFQRFIGIDYSGAKGPHDPLLGIRVFAAARDGMAQEIRDTTGGHWSRARLASWLSDQVLYKAPALIGIDHAFSFPRIYFLRHALAAWPDFLEDFVAHCPAHEHAVEDLRRKRALRIESNSALRVCEAWTSSAKSVFMFDVQGSVAKSTFAGLPWLQLLRQKAGDKLHVWPFDGWTPLPGRSVICEIYPAIFKRRYARADRGIDAHDAYSSASWMQDMSRRNALAGYFHPPLSEDERRIAALEGWILGVM